MAAIDRQLISHQLEEDPAAHKRALILLAILGYAYIFGLSIGMLLLAVAALCVLVYFRLFFLIKIAFLLAISVFVMFKAMWVKIKPPEGLKITRAEAPELFDEVERVRQQAGGPAIDTVLITDEFNCGIVQYPRLGLLGWYKNFLILGIPLLDALSEVEFKAVLAHEMGHLSEQHGSFGAWVYRVRTSWIQIFLNVHQENAFGKYPIRKFAEWFVPKFDLRALAVMRSQELAADQIAARVSGGDMAAKALITTSVRGSQLSEKFWTAVLNRIKTEPEPPKDVFAQLQKKITGKMPPDEAERWLRQNWRKHDEMDSHPSLSERVAALQPDNKISDGDLDLLAEKVSACSEVAVSSSDVLLGGAAARIRRTLNEQWRNPLIAAWKLRHQEVLEQVEQLSKLQKAQDKGELTAEDADKLALLALSTKNDDDAIEIIHPLLEQFPNRAVLLRCLGTLLIDKGLEEGVEYLDRAASLEPVYGCECYARIASYMQERGKTEAAQAYEARAKQCATEMVEASEAARQLTTSDKYSEHTLSQEEVARLCNQLYHHDRVEKAWLVKRSLPEIIGGAQHVLVVNLKSEHLSEPNEAILALQKVALIPECEGFYLVTWSVIKTNLGKACKTLPGAAFYERKNWPSNVAYEEPAKPISKSVRPSFFARHKFNLILAALIIGFIIEGIFTQVKHPEHWESSTPESGNVTPQNSDNVAPQRPVHYKDYDSYMVAIQKNIKRNWFPPKGNTSKRTVVLFQISRDGQLLAVKIQKSSGDKACDQAAIAAVKRAAPFNPLPTDVPKVDIEFTLDYNVYNQ